MMLAVEIDRADAIGAELRPAPQAVEDVRHVLEQRAPQRARRLHAFRRGHLFGHVPTPESSAGAKRNVKELRCQRQMSATDFCHIPRAREGARACRHRLPRLRSVLRGLTSMGDYWSDRFEQSRIEARLEENARQDRVDSDNRLQANFDAARADQAAANAWQEASSRDSYEIEARRLQDQVAADRIADDRFISDRLSAQLFDDEQINAARF